MSVRVKKNDKIKILTGKDTGKSGKVLLVDIKKGIVIVEGLNVVKKTRRPDQKSQKGGIIDIEAPIRVSNVMVMCPKCGKTMRVKKKELDDGKRVRICGKCGEMLDRD
ncbi:MAG: 50S ribosomal protein L24 [Spirochaetes bacterium]|nr:50S ribosomal protein L24 [Spirochaetota bacterium]MCK5569719.1 50S ribosomal protein L24 [Spirochaetota bacterium]